MNVAAGTRETFIPDIQGSVLAMLDSGSGALTKTGYVAFGENASAVTGTFRFTGQRFDGETAGSAAQPSGLYYYRARMYSPTLGRFMQPDPVGYQGGSHLYAYVNNDPLNATDPAGLLTGYLGFGASVAWIFGGESSGGLYITTSGRYGAPDIGYYASTGLGVGISSPTASASAGFVSGAFSNITGRTDVVTGGYALGAASPIFPPGQAPGGTPIGAAGGIQTPGVGIMMLKDETTATGLVDTLLDSLNSLLGNTPVPNPNIPQSTSSDGGKT